MASSKESRSGERRRRLSATLTESRAGSVVQGRLADSIQNSPYVQGQRARLAGMFGSAAQFRNAEEDEKSAPGQFVPARRSIPGSTVQPAPLRLPRRAAPVAQRSKEKVAAMVRTVKKLTEDLDTGKFAIGGSLALMMWHWALNPDQPVPRAPGDIDILLSDREESMPIGKKMIDEREGDLPEELKERMVRSFPRKFHGTAMTESEYGGFGVDLKEAGEGSRWGRIQSLLMPIIDIEEEYSLPIQSPEALLFGLLKKYKALEGREDEQQVVARDIDVAMKVIQQFEDYQKSI